jgi:hypothetical protein
MDEDPTNHDPSNLLALCPNCHLTDQHNPTARIDTEKLRLFRKYKDPVILSTEFDPLFQRLRFLDDVRDDCDIKKLQNQVKELVSFVQALQMGAF